MSMLMKILVLAVTLQVTQGQGYNAAASASNFSDYNEFYTDNEIDMKPTYRSNIEKFLQGLRVTLKSSQSIDWVSWISILPGPLKTFFHKPDNKEGSDGRGFGDVLNSYQDTVHNFNAILPGTLWCGGGNAAPSFNKVGYFSQSDACCRDHDSCSLSIAAGESLGRLKNNGIFTRSTCACDHEFYDCLKRVNSLVSANIGGTYFNLLRPQCFDYSYPIATCEAYDSEKPDSKCLKYTLDYSQNKTLEWFDLPNF